MTLSALLLVATAAVLHAYWNFLAKRSRDKVLFIWWTGVAGSLVFLPVFIGWTSVWPSSPRVWAGLGVSAGVRALYFASLGVAYTRGDLSLVYPLARGTAPIVVPPLAILFLGERPSAEGLLGVFTVALGIYVVHLPGLTRDDLLAPLRMLRSPHARYATLAGLMTATYTIIDKWNISGDVSPLVYAYVTVPGAALLLFPIALRRTGAAVAEWRANHRTIVAVAFLMTFAYFLVLLALRFTRASYVAAAREMSIVFGAIFGTVILGERYLLQRLTGAALIVAGVAILALSR
ncbi:MAG: EamA family transporter [Candidatus Rokubacteria bacterium]|nr:EamA family transporter [Candidatus Rokubacteria bacterium]